ncbi:hypothetical protein ACIBQ6_22045 [Nonomuraea sp. NPDC049655]|uniref:hypothetical protein n=1 Tax=Nonomuraea sp. NPDC049655 TaxID=3364355 RepID=UPI0037889BEA
MVDERFREEHNVFHDQIAKRDLAADSPSVVLADRNGNAMNIVVTCSCGAEMRRMNESRRTGAGIMTELACSRCGNRLTVTVS